MYTNLMARQLLCSLMPVWTVNALSQKPKLVAFSADITNTNNGGVKRRAKGKYIRQMAGFNRE
jgi:hypothetical protein